MIISVEHEKENKNFNFLPDTFWKRQQLPFLLAAKLRHTKMPRGIAIGKWHHNW